MTMWRTLGAFTCMLGLAAAISAQPGTPQRPGAMSTSVAPATASIAGRVLERSGLPVRSAEVRLRSENGRDDRIVTTAADGAFEFTDLTPGNWRMTASKAGYVSQTFSTAAASSTVRAAVGITLAVGQRFTGDITLLRGGAINGRVFDEFGDPLGGVRVTAVRVRTVQGNAQLVPTGAPDTSDDTGTFRLFGLMPGEYLVMALVRRPAGSHRAEASVYYPGTLNPASADLIRVRVAQDSEGATIQVPTDAPVTTVAGQVFEPDGAPARAGTVLLFSRFALQPSVNSPGIVASIQSDGRFVLPDVPAGSHLLEASSAMNGAAGGHALLPIEVGTSDVRDVVLVLEPDRSLTMAVVTDGGQPLPRPFTISLALESSESTGNSSVRAEVSAGRSLVMPHVWGQQRLRAAVATEGWMVKSISVEGLPIGDEPFDFSPLPAAAAGLIVVTDRVGQVSGTITSRGRPQRGAVVVFPEDQKKWRYPSPFIRTGRADAQGRFRIAGVPPGEGYRIVALSYLDADESQDPGFLAEIRRSGVAFRIDSGETKTIDVPLLER